MDSVPVERSGSFQKTRDAHTRESTSKGFADQYVDFMSDEDYSELEPSATQTDKSTFLWVPIIENDNNNAVVKNPPSRPPAGSSAASQLQHSKPPAAFGKTQDSCLWRDPYLLALDAAVGRSFTDQRIPPLKALKTGEYSERYKQHGIPRPPPSYRYPMRSALHKPPLKTPPRAHGAVTEVRAGQGQQTSATDDYCNEDEEEEGAIKAFEVQAGSKAAAEERQRRCSSPVPNDSLDSEPTMPNPFAHAEPLKRRRGALGSSCFTFSASGIRRSFSKFRSREPFEHKKKPTTTRSPTTTAAPSPTPGSNAPGSGAAGTYDLFRTRWSRMSSGRRPRQFTKTYPKRLADYMIDEEKGHGGAREQEQLDFSSDLEAPAAVDPECGALQQLPALSVTRYFEALEGPELQIPKECENLLLPPDERWPFLLRFPVGCFGISLGLASQALLWRTLATSQDLGFLRIPSCINLYLWCLCALSLVLISFIYMLKWVFFSEAVRREFHHPLRVNFFFTPWIVAMLLVLGVPSIITKSSMMILHHPAVWCVLMAPMLLLELKLYGQWISGGGDRRYLLSQFANPSTHLSVVGNFVGSILATTVGWKEPALFFWAVGLAQSLMLFAAIHQSSMLPSASKSNIEETRRTSLQPKEEQRHQLHPVFFLFILAPSAASIAWMQIVGDFDYVSRLFFFVALFLYSALILRIKFSRHDFNFSISWWAYTFPMTMASIAAILYCHEEAPSWIARGLAIGLSFVSSAAVFILCCLTLLQAFVWRSLFPNDLAIAITVQRPNFCKRKGSPTNEDSNMNSCGGLYSMHHSG